MLRYKYKNNEVLDITCAISKGGWISIYIPAYRYCYILFVYASAWTFQSIITNIFECLTLLCQDIFRCTLNGQAVHLNCIRTHTIQYHIQLLSFQIYFNLKAKTSLVKNFLYSRWIICIRQFFLSLTLSLSCIPWNRGDNQYYTLSRSLYFIERPEILNAKR